MTDGDGPDAEAPSPAPIAGAGVAPIPVLPLQYAPPAAPRPLWRRISRVCLVAAWVICFAGVLLLIYETETVVGTGPALFVLGVLVLTGGLLTRQRLAAFVGGCHCGICLLFFGLVNMLGWSPDEARTPFLLMGKLYTIAVAFPTGAALMRMRKETQTV